MTTFEKHQVVLLPGTLKSSYPELWLMHNKSQGLMYLKTATELDGVGQHLYVLSDEEIKQGDWYIHNQKTVGLRVQKCVGANLPIDAKKIIATTDKSLGADYNGAFGELGKLPQPPQEFIKHYVEEYNKSNVITEVGVEYEEIMVYKQTLNEGFGSYYHKEESEFVLKINPDNTINIKPKKDSWNREEITPLIDFLKDIAKDDLDRVSPGIKMRAMTYLAAFEKNL